ncbi:MAG TPA: response regulator, partial [Planctomycetota bacterium]|nr:response regulator [Planctomycetota bacterium]
MSVDQDPDTRQVRFKEVLVIDEDEAWALVMRDAVARGGFRVALATSLDVAIRAIRKEEPDLLLISCLLDAPAGETLLREIDALTPAPPVVLVGLQEGDHRWATWIPRPFVTVIRQPFKSQDVLGAVQALLDTAWEEITDETGADPKSGSPEDRP